MQLSNVLPMLFGAALVAVGVLAAALADRIRGVRVQRDAAPRERAGRAPGAPAAIPVIRPSDLLHASIATKPIRAVRTEPRSTEPKAAAEGGDEVIAALVGAGYKKAIAAEATWACPAGERASIEGWTAAAFRRCTRGGVS